MAFTQSSTNVICFFCQKLLIFVTRERAQAESAAAAEREADERQAQHLQEVERQRQEEQRRRIQVLTHSSSYLSHLFVYIWVYT